jgi:hypothetical protein
MAPTTQEIPRDAWRPYFDDLSRHLGTVEATVEVDGRDLGAQVVAERLVLTGVSYDNKDDVVVIGLDAPGGQREEFEHLVDHPQKVMIAAGTGDRVELAIDIEDAAHHQTIIRVERPPALPETADTA